MTSLWQLTAPAITLDDPGHAGNPGNAGAFDRAACDAVVVGAGLTGLVTAVLLARAGQRVAVLEARRVGAVSTGNAGGKLSLLQGTVFSEIRRHAGDEALRAYAEANREGQAWLIRELESRGEPLVRRTAYSYAESEDRLPALQQEFEAVAAAGIELVQTTDIGLPFEVAGALRLEDQVQLQPMIVLARLAEELRERGGTIIERCRVLDIEERRHGLGIITSQGEKPAGICVLATGTPILDRSMFFVNSTASRCFFGGYRLLGESVPQGMYLSLGAPSRSFAAAEGVDGAELLVVSGGAVRASRTTDTRRALDDLDRWAAERFADPHRLSWWAAQDYRTHSRIPFAGAVPRGGGRIFAATGYNNWGMTNAVAAALAIAGDALGGRMEWARVLREHAIGLDEASEQARSNALAAGRLISDWAVAELPSIAGAGEPEEGDGFVARDGIDPVAVSRLGGTVCRVSGVCPHLGGVLNWNAAERSWDCPLHGSRFDARGGLLEGPAVHDLPPARG